MSEPSSPSAVMPPSCRAATAMLEQSVTPKSRSDSSSLGRRPPQLKWRKSGLKRSRTPTAARRAPNEASGSIESVSVRPPCRIRCTLIDGECLRNVGEITKSETTIMVGTFHLVAAALDRLLAFRISAWGLNSKAGAVTILTSKPIKMTSSTLESSTLCVRNDFNDPH